MSPPDHPRLGSVPVYETSVSGAVIFFAFMFLFFAPLAVYASYEALFGGFPWYGLFIPYLFAIFAGLYLLGFIHTPVRSVRLYEDRIDISGWNTKVEHPYTDILEISKGILSLPEGTRFGVYLLDRGEGVRLRFKDESRTFEFKNSNMMGRNEDVYSWILRKCALTNE